MGKWRLVIVVHLHVLNRENIRAQNQIWTNTSPTQNLDKFKCSGQRPTTQSVLKLRLGKMQIPLRIATNVNSRDRWLLNIVSQNQELVKNVIPTQNLVKHKFQRPAASQHSPRSQKPQTPSSPPNYHKPSDKEMDTTSNLNSELLGKYHITSGEEHLGFS